MPSSYTVSTPNGASIKGTLHSIISDKDTSGLSHSSGVSFSLLAGPHNDRCLDTASVLPHMLQQGECDLETFLRGYKQWSGNVVSFAATLEPRFWIVTATLSDDVRVQFRIKDQSFGISLHKLFYGSFVMPEDGKVIIDKPFERKTDETNDSQLYMDVSTSTENHPNAEGSSEVQNEKEWHDDTPYPERFYKVDGLLKDLEELKNNPWAFVTT
jgi:hypothetical protein